MNIFRHICEEVPVTDFISKRVINYALLFQHQNRTYAYIFERKVSLKDARMLLEYSTGYLVYVLTDDQFNDIKTVINPVSLKDLEPVNEEIDTIMMPIGVFK